jgi:fucose permease
MVGLAGASAAAFAVRQLQARFPLIPRHLLRSARIALGLAGAFLGYLTLFGPLVLIPQLQEGHGNVVRTGLMLSALPVGFGVAALIAERIFPPAMPNRTRGSIGAAICAVALLLLMAWSASPVAVVLLLALAGLGLGVFVPANNAVIMRTGTAEGAGVLGGLVNMARGIGTTMGIALVTLALHFGTPHLGAQHPVAGAVRTARPDGTPAFLMLAAAAACAAVIAMTIRPLGRGGPEPDQTRLDHGDAFS